MSAPARDQGLTAESRDLMATLMRRHERQLAQAVKAQKLDRADWLDLIGEDVYLTVAEALPGIEQAAAEAAREEVFARIEAGALDDVNRAALTKMYEAGREAARAEVERLREACHRLEHFLDHEFITLDNGDGRSLIEDYGAMEDAFDAFRAALADPAGERGAK